MKHVKMLVVTNGKGDFLDQVRGQNRGWTTDLQRAQPFPTEGRAKVAYNHATARRRRINEARPGAYDVPEFQTEEVYIVLRSDYEAIQNR